MTDSKKPGFFEQMAEAVFLSAKRAAHEAGRAMLQDLEDAAKSAKEDQAAAAGRCKPKKIEVKVVETEETDE